MRTTVRRTAMVALVAVTLAGCSGGGGGGSSAADYVKGVCTAFKSAFAPLVTAESDIGKALSSSTSPSDAKSKLQTLIGDLVNAIDKAKSDIDALGTPSVTNGAQIKSSLDTALSQLSTALHSVESQIGNLPTASPAAFEAAARAITTSLTTAFSSFGNLGTKLTSPELEQAASKEPACKSIGA